MVSENEIRIGNWFHHNKEWTKENEEQKPHDFVFKYDHWFWIGECLFSLENIKPIRLNEEWLLKFGAKTHTGYALLGRFKFIYKSAYGYWYVLDSDTNNYMTKIEFVHELQNFIYVMDGEELTIKEQQS